MPDGRALPPGWEKVLDPGSGQYYFYNARQGVTQWDPPDMGSRSATATFTTVTTTRKPKAGYKARPVVNHNASFRQPVAYAHRSPRVIKQTTVRTTTRDRRHGHVGGRGGGSGVIGCGCQFEDVNCTGGDWIFMGTLFGIVILVIALISNFGIGTGTNIGLSNRNDYNNYQYRTSMYLSNTAASTKKTAVASGCVAGYDDVATVAQCGLLGEVLKLVNEHRASMNNAQVKPLRANALLNTAAQRHACWMADKTTMSHTGGPAESDKEFGDRVKKSGYKFNGIAENVAAGQSTAQSVVTAWLNSPGHRRNIENKNYDEIGLGLGQTDEGMKNYWCQVFGSSDDQTGANAPSCRTIVEAYENAGGRVGNQQSYLVAVIVGSAFVAAVQPSLC